VTRAELQALVARVQAAHPEVEVTLRAGLTDRDGYFARKHYRVDIALRVVHDVYVAPEDLSTASEVVVDFLDEEIDTLVELCSEDTRIDIRVERMLQESRDRAAAERRGDVTPTQEPPRRRPLRVAPPSIDRGAGDFVVGTSLWELLDVDDPKLPS
jgi:hypothetical protein